MTTLVIIGNGFDLGHDLPTRFDDFINSNPNLYRDKYGIFSNGNNSWNEIESKYEKLLHEVMDNRIWQNLSEEFDKIRTDYGLNDYGEVNYYGYTFEGYDEELNIISDYISLLVDFEHDFLTYLREYCSDEILRNNIARKRISKIINQADRIVTFNYTHTAEILYNAKNIIHIHGDVNDSIAIGSGTLEDAKASMIDYEYPRVDQFSKDKEGLIETMAYYTKALDGHLVEDSFARRFFDEVVVAAQEKERELFELLNVKSKDSLDERRDIIDLMKSEHYDKVYIIGHSLGKADRSVLEAFNKDAKVICSYYNKAERFEKKKKLKSLGLACIMISDWKLYR